MNKRFIIVATAVLALSSCSFLDRDPRDKLAPENYFRNEQDLKLFSNSFYDNLLDKSPFDEQSDIIFTKGAISDELLGGAARTVPSKASSGGWSWGQLRKINTMLGNMDKCEDEAVAKQYTGLAKFFRARFYFDKVRRFGDVPWYDHELGSTETDELYKARDSRELIMSHMLEDVDDAIASLPEEKSVYRVNKWAALMEKAQFCLYEGTFRKYHGVTFSEGLSAEDYLRLAADAAYEVISKGPYSLAPDYGLLFREPDADQNEYILAIHMDAGIATHNGTGYCLMNSAGCPGFSKKFIDSFLMKDGSRYTDQAGWETKTFIEQMADRDPRLGMITRLPSHVRKDAKKTVYGPDVAMTSTGYQYDKFVMDESYETAGRADMSFNDMPVYRLGEAYLIYAEAKAELNEFTQEVADESINKLRARAGMPSMDVASLTVDPFLISDKYGYRNIAQLNPSNLAQILEVRRERTIELVLEVPRWDDIVRWKEGRCYEQPLIGMYFPGPGAYDLSGDDEPDLVLYDTAKKPSGYSDDVTCLQIQEIEIDGKNVAFGGDGIVLSEGKSGFVSMYRTRGDRPFNEERDYLYPIPSGDRLLNPNLAQNPGWVDAIGTEDEENN